MDLIPHPNKTFMAHFDRYEPVIQDSTAMKIFKRCDRKYFYRIVLGRTPKNNYNQVVLDAGSIYHKFRELLEHYWNLGKDPNECLSFAAKDALSLPFKPAPDKSKWIYVDHVLLMKAFKEAFFLWEKQKTQGAIKVVGSEMPWNVQMPDGTIIGGRNDQLWKWNGLLWICDFKFSSKNKEKYDKEVEPNDQATRYIYGATKLHGGDVQGIIFEVLHHEKNKESNKVEIFQSTTQRTSSQLKQWEKEQIHLNEQLANNRKKDIWPMRELTGAWDNKGCEWCEYANVCRKPSEASAAAALSADFKLSPWDCTVTEQQDIEA